MFFYLLHLYIELCVGDIELVNSKICFLCRHHIFLKVNIDPVNSQPSKCLMTVNTISIWKSIKFCNFYISHARLRIQCCNIWKCFTYSFVGENKGNFFFKTIDAEVLKWHARRPETIIFLFWPNGSPKKPFQHSDTIMSIEHATWRYLLQKKNRP